MLLISNERKMNTFVKKSYKAFYNIYAFAVSMKKICSKVINISVERFYNMLLSEVSSKQPFSLIRTNTTSRGRILSQNVIFLRQAGANFTSNRIDFQFQTFWTAFASPFPVYCLLPSFFIDWTGFTITTQVYDIYLQRHSQSVCLMFSSTLNARRKHLLGRSVIFCIRYLVINVITFAMVFRSISCIELKRKYTKFSSKYYICLQVASGFVVISLILCTATHSWFGSTCIVINNFC